mgnify:CR=1 FL=1
MRWMIRAIVAVVWLLPFLAAAGDDPLFDWMGLKNPILSLPDRMLKDQAVAIRGGYFYLFASTRSEGPEPADAACFFRTPDFKEFERLESPGLTVTFGATVRGPASPDLVRRGDDWFIVFQAGPKEYFRRLYYSSSADLVSWSPAAAINPGMKPRQRQIDGALAFEAGHWILGYKGGQSFYVTRSKGPELDGRWERPVRASAGGEWAENFQFIKIEGRWRMVATARGSKNLLAGQYTGNHDPFIYEMDGDGSELADWARWKNRTALEVPGEDWNRVMKANSGYLCDWREYDGHFYLFYAGANDGERFAGRGHAMIGVARSLDLVTWRLPGQAD